MIAANFRKFPEAMALQLVLAFGRCKWHTSRPTTRVGRAQRAEQARLVKATAQIVRWIKVPTPAWWKQAQREAKALARTIKANLTQLVWDEQPITAST